jgi:general secretion pathway protein F
MKESTGTAAPALSLDELIAINDELAALVRAGVPLERTLGNLGRDLPGRLGRATAELAARIERGETLSQALAAMPNAFPPVYRAAVEAGLRSGNLPVALEALSHAARRLAELRRVVVLAMLYPLFVIVLAYGLFVFFLSVVLPAFPGVLERHAPRSLLWFVELGRSAWWWWPIPPLALLLVGGIWWIAARRGWVALPTLPVIGPLLADARLAIFCELLSLLVARETPLPEAIGLAADAVGDAELARAAAAVASELRAGRPLTVVAPIERLAESDATPTRRPGLPPFMLWLLASSDRRSTLISLLGHTAEMYRRRVFRRSDWLRYYLPTLLTVTLGGGVTLCFALSLFMPLIQMFNQIAVHGMSRGPGP